MSKQYDEYLIAHRDAVGQAFDWIQENLPELLGGTDNFEWQIKHNHDTSKNDLAEYDAYDAYFYGENRSYAVVQDFNRAWLHHIHNNPHHWQHWILVHDEPGDDTIIRMPYLYVIEMICDWWSFAFRKGDLNAIFTWWDKHKDYIRLNKFTRKEVEYILGKIKDKLEELNNA